MKKLMLLLLVAAFLLTVAARKEELPTDDWEENLKDLPSDFNEKLYGSETPWESELSEKEQQ